MLTKHKGPTILAFPKHYRPAGHELTWFTHTARSPRSVSPRATSSLQVKKAKKRLPKLVHNRVKCLVAVLTSCFCQNLQDTEASPTLSGTCDCYWPHTDGISVKTARNTCGKWARWCIIHQTGPRPQEMQGLGRHSEQPVMILTLCSQRYPALVRWVCQSL